jgi:transcriptional regulator of acetoin/glycerol metabolism
MKAEDSPDRSLSERLDAIEHAQITSALRGRSVRAAARLLGADRSDLYRRMRRLSIDWRAAIEEESGDPAITSDKPPP